MKAIHRRCACIQVPSLSVRPLVLVFLSSRWKLRCTSVPASPSSIFSLPCSSFRKRIPRCYKGIDWTRRRSTLKIVQLRQLLLKKVCVSIVQYWTCLRCYGLRHALVLYPKCNITVVPSAPFSLRNHVFMLQYMNGLRWLLFKAQGKDS